MLRGCFEETASVEFSLNSTQRLWGTEKGEECEVFTKIWWKSTDQRSVLEQNAGIIDKESSSVCLTELAHNRRIDENKKHLKNIGLIRYCEPFYIIIHQVSLLPPLSHAACASMSTTTTTTRDRGDRYGPMEWAQWLGLRLTKEHTALCNRVAQ